MPVPASAPYRFALDRVDRDAGPREHGRQRLSGDTAPTISARHGSDVVAPAQSAAAQSATPGSS
jgi:hypothetical protein